MTRMTSSLNHDMVRYGLEIIYDDDDDDDVKQRFLVGH